MQLARVLTQVWSSVRRDRPRWLLLDEPVASLDIAHQFTVLRIAREFADQGGGVVVVMHDLNLTALFADKVCVLSNGEVWRTGAVSDVMTDEVMRQVYGIDLSVSTLPATDVPFILPQARMPWRPGPDRRC
ncbi:hypothetical protein SAMN05444279_13221 [Ruegeria intermedia]|uniref:Iron complex transport system ATP-binding protein n=1 Tax=Ruegeria intermedia TaxID=996115 RepID=A0A1M5B4P8_9RHOB|nr:hypothetical protein [Ruegeria intermedia]SHF37425.1 hypothetical protein SAMN05444279_13221 [Ruegeria intermedia]